ncbi:VPLPA-CTERM sorting domain-containing protein [Halieaceae bacterium IMCC14734]|uniref:VPLPA-CTERM sorting domain-containing protein n=1 Tax=Candidatus Litorirhabdus singularis TaxID=2518993 RepID=A0ABT3TGG7_9GAMM|nr:choice-of-anchor E domain-containing protein [Candidatus Litorirhabdus singularis]MCX2981401.1 VPLPA-CTERM sorting domain-containing protein [Candidatus Litorirhabdus singularis]
MEIRKHKTIQALTLAVSLGFAAASAQAATVSYTGSTGISDVSASSLDLEQFDASLGTLTGIAIDWDMGFSGAFFAIRFSQDGTASGENSFIASTAITTAAPAGAAGPALNASAGVAFDVNVPEDYQQNYSGETSDSQSFGPLAAFVGNGLVSYDFWGMASATSTVSNGVFSGIDTHRYQVDAEITYTYSPVPLPAAAWLFGSALLGLAGVARRRKS